MTSNSGWIGPTSAVLEALESIGADRDDDGNYLLTGEAPTSFLGLGDELCVPERCMYLLKGEPCPLYQLLYSHPSGATGCPITVI